MPEKLGKYEILSQLATGGMAQIYLAKAESAPGVDQVVVIKRLLPDYAAQPEFVGMFFDEARIQAALSHPNIVHMSDFGTIDNVCFMAMEYLHGENLRTLRRALLDSNRTLPLEHAITIGAGVCAALQHAHEARAFDGTALEIVHRDISPQNVVVTFDGAVKLLDFGVAKAKNRKSETRTGVLKGKVPYMPPEQLKSERIGRGADIYALGIVLYEMTTGQRPYIVQRRGEFDLMLAIVQGKIKPPRDARPDLPQGLADIITKALAYRPTERFQSAAEFQTALEEFAAQEKLVLSARSLGAFMRDVFHDRLERWSMVKPTAERIVEFERAKNEVPADGDGEGDVAIDIDEVTSIDHEDDYSEPSPDSMKLPALSAPNLSVTHAKIGDINLVTIAGRLTESFPGTTLGAALQGRVLFDLSAVDRITSFGVREWLSMMEEARARHVRTYIARASEAVTTQLGMIRMFAGGGPVVSFFAPYLCATCGTSFKHLVDCETDAATIRARQPPLVDCPTCGADASLDDDPSYMAFAVYHAGTAIPAPVRAAVAQLAANAADQATESVEKQISGDVTRLRVRNEIDKSFRWARPLDGLEGRVIIDFESARVTKEGAASFVDAVNRVDSAVTRIELQACPVSVLSALARAPSRSSRVFVVSIHVSGRCAACMATRSALVTEEQLTTGALGSVACRRCGEALELEGILEAWRSFAGAAKPSAAPATVPVVSNIEPTRPSRTPLFVVAGALVGILLFGSALAFSLSRRAPAVSIADAALPAAPAAPAWINEAAHRDGSAIIVVGCSGPVAGESEGLQRAQAEAVRSLTVYMLDQLPQSTAKTFVADRRVATHDRARSMAVSSRFLRSFGATATPERTESAIVRSPTLEVCGRYKVGVDAVDNAVAAYGRTTTLSGVTFARVFPLLEERFTSDGDLIAIAVDDRPRRAGIVAGDVLLRLDGHTIASLDELAGYDRRRSLAMTFERDGKLFGPITLKP